MLCVLQVPMSPTHLVPNLSVRSMVEEWVATQIVAERSAQNNVPGASNSSAAQQRLTPTSSDLDMR
jgi:hypothetical protein